MSQVADDDSAQAGTKVKDDKSQSDEEILEEARDRYEGCTSIESDNRKQGLDDLLFLSGGVNQWDAIDVAARTAQRRPMITVNNLPTFLHQVTNEQRLNKLGGKVSPVDSGADEETAEVIQGLIRHIEYDSNASVATTTAVNSAAAIGWGWFRLVTDYESPTSFDQKLMFKRIRNPLSVHIDPLSQELDGSDSKYFFIDSLESRKEFEKAYPKASANDTSLIGQQVYQKWLMQDTVLVCEYYRIREIEDTLCMYADGTAGWKSDKSQKPKMMGADGKPRERESARRVVEWFKMTGADILERTVIKCDWIPVFPIYGDEIDIEGKVIRSGVIRNSKDSFKMYNVCITTAIEEVATRAKSPYIMAEGQDEGHEAQWNNINRVPYSSVKYKPKTLEGNLLPPPQRTPMADIPSGWLSMTMHFADNKKATTGLFDSSLGAKGTATSGIQEREQQQQGDMANYHYADNAKITYKHALRCIVNMIPHYYDAARTVRILGEDETSEVVNINQPIQRQNKQSRAIETVMHDLTVGTYDVTVQAGPSFQTQRQESAEFFANAMQAAKDPATSSVLTILALENQDAPGIEKAIKLLKKLPPLNAIVEPEEGETPEPMVQTPNGPMPISKVGQLIEQMGQALQNADQQLERAQLDKIENQKRELDIKQQEADTKRGEAETARMAAESKSATEAEKAQADMIEAEAKRLQAEADNLRARAESTEKEVIANNARAPQIEEVLALVQASKPQVPTAMTVTAPSGQVYDVRLDIPVS